MGHVEIDDRRPLAQRATRTVKEFVAEEDFRDLAAVVFNNEVVGLFH